MIETPRSGPVGVGIIGAGVISEQYLTHLSLYPDVRVVGIADLALERAQARAAQFGTRAFESVEELLASTDVEIVVVLTIPSTHVDLSIAALEAGKHVWSEKPISLDRESAEHLVSRARAANRLVGIAPDTVLGAGIQAGVRAVREGRIGTPLSAITAVQNPGPDVWHPDPAFLFKNGAGPVLDLGPYYATTLVHVFGPAARVRATGRITHRTRVVRSGPKVGEVIEVEMPTNVGVILEFESGAFALSQFSFDSPLIRLAMVEITGTGGTLVFTDPNTFDGEPRLVTIEDQDGERLTTDADSLGRGIGIVDMARTIRNGGGIVASADVALHVIDILLAIEEAVESGESVEITTTLPEVPTLPEGWDPRVATVA